MIEFRALGPAELVGPEGADTEAVLARPKLLGLLSYLTVHSSSGFHRRDSLVGVFWPELDQQRARSAVRQSLYRLRQALGPEAVLTRGDDEVAISEVGVRCDVREFEDLLGNGERKSALDLYRGDLLEGLYVPDAPEFERWLDARRQQLLQHAANAAWELAEREAARRLTGAAGHWSRLARDLTPLDERLLRRVIKLLDRLGDRVGAVREYEAFSRLMAEELELEPSPETRALVDRVRERGEVVTPDVTPPPERVDVSVSQSAAAQPEDWEDSSFAQALADRYRLEKQIGVGGMATVYLARDLRHQRDVAVKVMFPDLPVFLGVERFLREIRIAANLSHPHIVPVYDSGSAEGQLYYVMPYVEGESLRTLLDRERQLPLEEALEIARDVAEALDHAHSHGIVHRDIKPENILLADGHALVTDFGVARALSVTGRSELTRAGIVVGTPRYMSPEQSSGSGEVDGRSDLYSLACVLFEMLAGEPPFAPSESGGTVGHEAYSPPRSITDLRSTVPLYVSAAIARALENAPADRFKNASDFLDALSRDSSGKKPRLRLWNRAGPTRIVAVAALLIVFAVVLVVLSRDPRNGTPTLDRNRVLVMPLDNRTGDTTMTLFGSLAADWIAQGLQEIDVIDVVPTVTAINPGPEIPSAGGRPDGSAARLAGETTGAGTLVAGAYYQRGDSLEFQIQVVDAIEQRLMRAVPTVAEPIAATDTILNLLRRSVVTTVAAALDQRLMVSLASSRPPSLEAYRVYLEGHRMFYGTGPPRMREVLEIMNRAVTLDSSFADPRFFIVMAHFNLGEFAAADSVVSKLDPFRSRFSPYQRAFLDWLSAGLRGDRAAALQAARERGVRADMAVEALRSNRLHEVIELLTDADELPALYYQWRTLMDALHMVGDYEAELREVRRAREVYPDRLVLLGNELRALVGLGRLDEVEDRIDESLLLPPEGEMVAEGLMGYVAAELRAHGFREVAIRVAEVAVRTFRARTADEQAATALKAAHAANLYLAERWEDARAVFQELATESPTSVRFLGYLGVVAARRGDREEALRISDRLEGMADPYDFGHDVYRQACIAAQLGELERAMSLLREAHARGRAFTVFLHIDMDLEPLHGYPPFEAFVRPAG